MSNRFCLFVADPAHPAMSFASPPNIPTPPNTPLESKGTSAIPMRAACNHLLNLRMRDFMANRKTKTAFPCKQHVPIVYDLDDQADHVYPEPVGFPKNRCRIVYPKDKQKKEGDVSHCFATNHASTQAFIRDVWPPTYKGTTPVIQTQTARNSLIEACKTERTHDIGLHVNEMKLTENEYSDLKGENVELLVDPKTGNPRPYTKKFPSQPANLKITFKNDFGVNGKTREWEFGASPTKRVVTVMVNQGETEQEINANKIIRKTLTHSEFGEKIYENEHLLRSFNPALSSKIPRLVKRIHGPHESLLYTLPRYVESRQDWYYPDIRVVEQKTGSYKKRILFQESVEGAERTFAAEVTKQFGRYERVLEWRTEERGNFGNFSVMASVPVYCERQIVAPIPGYVAKLPDAPVPPAEPEPTPIVQQPTSPARPKSILRRPVPQPNVFSNPHDPRLNRSKVAPTPVITPKKKMMVTFQPFYARPNPTHEPSVDPQVSLRKAPESTYSIPSIPRRTLSTIAVKEGYPPQKPPAELEPEKDDPMDGTGAA